MTVQRILYICTNAYSDHKVFVCSKKISCKRCVIPLDTLGLLRSFVSLLTFQSLVQYKWHVSPGWNMIVQWYCPAELHSMLYQKTAIFTVMYILVLIALFWIVHANYNLFQCFILIQSFQCKQANSVTALWNMLLYIPWSLKLLSFIFVRWRWFTKWVTKHDMLFRWADSHSWTVEKCLRAAVGTYFVQFVRCRPVSLMHTYVFNVSKWAEQTWVTCVSTSACAQGE